MEQTQDTKTTQCAEILTYIVENGCITSAAAMMDLGIYRLASRIHDLKKAGYNIQSKWEVTKNRYGREVRYKSYSF